MYLKQLINEFIYTKPELAKVLLSCKVRKSTTVPTMAVSITRQPNLYINEKFLAELTTDEAIAVVTHEMYHLINLHPARGEEKNPQIFNYAADLAINQFIKGLPYGVMDIDEFKKIKQFKNLEPKRSTEYYYNKLHDAAEEMEQELRQMLSDAGMDQDEIDDYLAGHSKWQESVSESEARQVMQDIFDNKSVSLSDVKEEMDKEMYKQYRHYGNEPKQIEEELDEGELRKVNWKDILKDIRNVRYKRVKEKTIHRRNKRYDWLAGRARKKKKLTDGRRRVKRLFFAMDVSGSISNEMCSNFISNAKELEPYVDDLTLIQCSAEIHDVEVIKKDGKKVKEIDFTRKGNGGTSFIPVFDYIEENFNTEKDDYYLLYLTDTHGPFPEDNRNIQTIWLSCVEDGYNEPPFGKIYFFDDY